MTVGPLQVEARVVSRRPVGAYHHLVLAVPPALADEVVPGHFVAVAVGGRRTSMLLRRAFSIYRADPVAGTIEVVFAVQGAGTDWMSGIAAGELLDVVAPLGRPFRRPTTPTRCLLVAGGYGAAPMFELARQRVPPAAVSIWCWGGDGQSALRAGRGRGSKPTKS